MMPRVMGRLLVYCFLVIFHTFSVLPASIFSEGVLP